MFIGCRALLAGMTSVDGDDDGLAVVVDVIVGECCKVVCGCDEAITVLGFGLEGRLWARHLVAPELGAGAGWLMLVVSCCPAIVVGVPKAE